MGKKVLFEQVSSKMRARGGWQECAGSSRKDQERMQGLGWKHVGAGAAVPACAAAPFAGPTWLPWPPTRSHRAWRPALVQGSRWEREREGQQEINEARKRLKSNAKQAKQAKQQQ